MREIKFRQPIYIDGRFSSWHKWGFWDGNFYGPYVSGEITMERAEKESRQYTGLKDKSGKEIYEGDIVQPINFNSSYRIAIVKFKGGCFCVESMGMCKEYDCLSTKSNFEIVGNIDENPELLE